MSRIFYRHISFASNLWFDTETRNIVYTTTMYNAKELRQERREVTIDEEEWRTIVKYGKEAGFDEDV